VPERVRRIHRGVLDGLSRAEIAARYLAEPGEAALVTRLNDGRVVELSRSRMRDAAELPAQAPRPG
jgi:protein AroM